MPPDNGRAVAHVESQQIAFLGSESDRISAATQIARAVRAGSKTRVTTNPKDAEVWLQLGDVAVHQGDEVRAREYYTRASQIDPQASIVIADAQKRLALMAEVSRNPGSKR